MNEEVRKREEVWGGGNKISEGRRGKQEGGRWGQSMKGRGVGT